MAKRKPRPSAVTEQPDARRLRDMQTHYEGDRARFKERPFTKDSLDMAAAYWFGYPIYLGSIRFWLHEPTGSDAKEAAPSPTDYAAESSRAEHALTGAHVAAVELLMEAADQNGIDPGPLYECAQWCRRLFSATASVHLPGDMWPWCIENSIHRLPVDVVSAIDRGQASLLRLSIKLDIQRPKAKAKPTMLTEPLTKTQLSEYFEVDVRDVKRDVIDVYRPEVFGKGRNPRYRMQVADMPPMWHAATAAKARDISAE